MVSGGALGLARRPAAAIVLRGLRVLAPLLRILRRAAFGPCAVLFALRVGLRVGRVLVGPFAPDRVAIRLALGRAELQWKVGQTGDRVLGGGARQDRAGGQQDGDDRGPQGDPHAGHSGGHLHAALPQVSAQAQEARRHQQSQPGRHVDTEQLERPEPPRRVAAGDKQLPQAEQRQCGEREIDDPDARCVGLPLGAAAEMGLLAHPAHPLGDALRFGRLLVLDCAGGLFFRFRILLRLLAAAGQLEQPLARRVLLLVDQGAVPGELMRRPPGQGEEEPVEEHRVGESHCGQADGAGQRQGEEDRPLAALLDGDPRDEHDRQNEAAENPVDAAVVLALVEDGHEEPHQAPDHQHDQHGADRDGDVVGEGLVETGHG